MSLNIRRLFSEQNDRLEDTIGLWRVRIRVYMPPILIPYSQTQHRLFGTCLGLLLKMNRTHCKITIFLARRVHWLLCARQGSVMCLLPASTSWGIKYQRSMIFSRRKRWSQGPKHLMAMEVGLEWKKTEWTRWIKRGYLLFLKKDKSSHLLILWLKLTQK